MILSPLKGAGSGGGGGGGAAGAWWGTVPVENGGGGTPGTTAPWLTAATAAVEVVKPVLGTTVNVTCAAAVGPWMMVAAPELLVEIS